MKTSFILLIVLLLLAPTVAAEESDPRALEIADQVLDAMGGEDAWNQTRYVSWLFFGRRQHYWDRYAGDIRIESENTILLMNLNSREGRAFEEGVEVTDPVLRSELLEKAYAWWVNDSYWVFMPYKLRDEGVRLRHLGERAMESGRPAYVLEMTFESVGLTPQNKYEVLVDTETLLVGEWVFYENAEDAEPGFTIPWNDWRKVGRILLAGNHGRGHDWRLQAYDELPRAVFEDSAPITLD